MIVFHSNRELDALGCGSESTRRRRRAANPPQFPDGVNFGTTASPLLRWPSDELEAYCAAIRAGKSLEEATEVALRIRQTVIDDSLNSRRLAGSRERRPQT